MSDVPSFNNRVFRTIKADHTEGDGEVAIFLPDEIEEKDCWIVSDIAKNRREMR